ncbi:ABC transporter ATP-binding protein [Caenimonas koreensis]|uniref:ABC transporter ATP-binding protein n=1 Tax=Caenimonas koreensis TaxID=367474 RepID=UPI003783A8CC
MSSIAIRAEGLAKQYVISNRHSTLYDALIHTMRLSRSAERSKTATEPFWALQDISFEIQAGEVVGVIGRNGAGKSTLLKILSRITAPTRGRVHVTGRLASLLEVGTGFHPELSGRENVYLNGAILGMTRAEISNKFDDIVGFAEIEKFIDLPVKRYSSGMAVRLAFAVAAHLDPDILIIDEVLAVGDAEFQRKCIGKMNEVRQDGKTVLLVSHNIAQLSALCGNAIWLDKGKLVDSGEFGKVASAYLKNSRNSLAAWIPESTPDLPFSYEEVAVIAPIGTDPSTIPAALPLEIRLAFVVRRQLTCRIGLFIADADGTIVLSSANTDGSTFSRAQWLPGRHALVCVIPGNLLRPGPYYLSVSLPTDAADEVLYDVCSFTVDSSDSLVTRDGRRGVIAPKLEWRIE